MKRTLLTLAGISILSVYGMAQTIPNPSFENWTTDTLFEDPAGWLSTNFQAFLTIGTPNVTKSTDCHSGTYALKLETMPAPGGIIPGGLFIGNPGPGGISGGIPYNERPDSIQGWVKYDIVPNDTAQFVVFFKNNGITIGACSGTMEGLQTTWLHFSIAITWIVGPGTNPDTIAAALFSSNPGAVTTTGSVVYLDDLFLHGSTTQIPNSGFENWTSFSIEEPDLWATSNPYTMTGSGISVTRSTDHHDGIYSIRLENKVTGGSGDTTSFLTNGFIGNDGPAGGTPVPYNPEKFSFWYKYAPQGPDSALAGGWLFRHSSSPDTNLLLEKVMHRLPAASSWTYHEIPFTYNSWLPADTINIAFAGGNVDGNAYAGVGSVLYVDDIHLVIRPMGIGTNAPVQQAGVFPNPATSQIMIHSNNGLGETQVEILSLSGQLLKSIIRGTSLNMKIDISDLPAGTYFYRICKGKSQQNGKFVKL
jgi:hypothetical protein